MPTKRVLEELIVKLEADTRAFRSELRVMQQQTDRTTFALQRSFQRVGKAVAGLSVVAGTHRLFSELDQVTARLDTIAKASSKLGVSTDFFQEFTFAAEQSGISTQTAELALQRFTRRAAEAATGTGEARAALQELGISAEDLRRKSPEELFVQATRALADTTDAADRLRLAFKLFDSEGAALVNLVDQFEELRRVAREAGIVIDRETIEAAVKAKDELNLLSRAIEAQLAPQLVQLAPLFVSVGSAAVKAATGVSEFFDSFSETEQETIRALEFQIDRMSESIERRAKRIKQLEQEGGGGATALDRFFGGSGELIEARGEQRAQVARRDATRVALAQLLERDQNVQPPPGFFGANERGRNAPNAAADAAAKRLAAEQATAAKAARSDVERFEALQETLTRTLASAQEDRRQLIELDQKARDREITERGQAAVSALRTLAEQDSEIARNLAADVAQIREQQLAAIATSAEAAAGELRQLLEKEASEAEKLAKKAGESADAMAEHFSRAFADMLLTGEFTFARLGESLVRDLLSKLIQTGLTSAFTGLGGLVGSVLPGLTNRAAGGPVGAGQLVNVNESPRGIGELFIPRTAGAIVPVNPLTSSGGGGDVYVTITGAPSRPKVTHRRTGTGQNEIDIAFGDMLGRQFTNRTPGAQAMEAVYGLRSGARRR